MSIEEYVRTHRAEIDSVIGHQRRIDDDERELWVMNDEYLYNRAKEAGVDI